MPSQPLPRRALLIGSLGAVVVAATPGAAGAQTPSESRTLRPEDFGLVDAAGADHTRALQSVLDALRPGDVLWLGRTYRHSAVLRVRVPGVTIDGPGALVATNPLASAVSIEADRVTIRRVRLAAVGLVRREYEAPQMKVFCDGRDGLVVEDVTIDGSAAAGIYLHGASNFRISRVTIRRTLADSVHMTGGSHDGLVEFVQSFESGDDGVAVVSYRKDAGTCHGIRVENCTVSDQRWGRGFSVVGGYDVTIRWNTVNTSCGAGLYLASEGDPFFTQDTHHVVVEDLYLNDANTGVPADGTPAPVHGAVLFYSAGPGHRVHDIRVTGLHVRRPSPAAGRVVGLVGPDVWAIDCDTSDLDVPAGTVRQARIP